MQYIRITRNPLHPPPPPPPTHRHTKTHEYKEEEPVQLVQMKNHRSNTCRKDLSWLHFDDKERKQVKDQQSYLPTSVASLGERIFIEPIITQFSYLLLLVS